ncbi:energy-coupling factor transporter transmembrane protein EcfT [Cohnella pontilimi]|uniref:Energy-coupling factor transporter transmembrane protein EcfT n=1 Tax=Cohnella pontilimi TaxID=2564100 RepID=A0A4U0FEN8_9BACL|nr:energy-coupling factor transporter transmembrane component T [Cohnella pontilimi]TJY41772.1 energy-coupling factor transporter transmembrane protein EcfT [Cohnella pontilimi]
MKAKMLSYTRQDSPIHRLTGAVKLLFFVLWCVTAMITYDTRCLLAMFVFSLAVFKISKVKFRNFSFVLYLILFFMLLNQLAVYLFSPAEGVKIYGTSHELFHFAGRYNLTAEQLFYQFNILLKYFTVIPMALLFLLTTDPSEFAASLNRIGVSYRISYAVSIAMRYIPDIQRDFQNIAFAAQARGIDMSKKEKLGARIKNVSAVLMPLILTSLQRIETISAAMELRAFGHGRTRTWYNARPFAKGDFLALVLIVAISAGSTLLTFYDGTRFYNIFLNR